MWSVSSSSLQLILVPPWKLQTKLLYHHSNSKNLNIIPPYFHPIFNSFSKDEPLSSTPNKYQLRYDPSEEIFGLDDVGVPQRDMKSDTFEPRSWFGPNGQYIKELPCPSCRGRGYTPCTECGIERSRQDCSLCNGKGMMTCQRCLGECVIWEELIDEIPWEKARSISPIKVKEDDDVDNMELKPAERKKSNRVYRSTPPEVGQKISRSLKSLNAKTGLFSKRMKLIHRDPTLHAQRVAAIKKVKGTAASRKHTSEMLKKFFSDPENRRKRSISMRGVRFFCKNCGQEGHRSFYCPQRGETADRRFKCGLCGQKGHNRLTCQRPRTSKPKKRILGEYCCRACGKVGHNRRTCPVKIEISSHNAAPKKRGSHCSVCGKSGHNKRTCLQHANEEQPNLNTEKKHHCRVCGEVGHNRRTCSLKTVQPHNAAHENPSLFQDSKGNDQKHHHRCSRCGKVGHNRRTCSQQYSVEKPELNAAVSQSVRRPHHCRICGVIGHNKRTCAERELKAL